MPGPSHVPSPLRHCVAATTSKGRDTSSAFAVCTAQLQKSGVLKKGSQDLTSKGEKTAAEHEKEPTAAEKDAAYEKALKAAKKYEARALFASFRVILMESGWIERIPGGLAAGKTPQDFDPEQLALGISIEMEHSTDVGIATEIAMDHLAEDPDYYQKLVRMEKEKPVKHEDRSAIAALTEADEIDEYDLSPSDRKLRAEVATMLDCEPGTIWRGGIGTILEFDGGSGTRITKKQLDGLAKIRDLRWFETRPNGYAIGI